jgi:uncharacterized protein
MIHELCMNTYLDTQVTEWTFCPEGAAIHAGERVAVIADMHLGYEWARGRAGDLLPAHSLAETLDKLTRLLERVGFDRLVVAGDMVESSLPCSQTEEDIEHLVSWLSARGVELIALRGNHDPPRQPPLAETLDVGGWTIGHGDEPIVGSRVIFGHHHPVLRAAGTTAPCFLVGPTMIVLPAFSRNAAGLAVNSCSLPPELRKEALRCWASTGEELLDFGVIVRELPRAD